MLFRVIPLLIAAMMVLILSCGDTETTKIVDSGGGEPEPILFADFVHFDTTLFMIVRTTMAPPVAEAYTWCEKSVGEPFTDNNGNGVYDFGIDSWIKSRGPDNQDLNDNGVHDGPEDPWSPGVPFDDLDGDGVRDCDSNWQGFPNREQGVPYCDLNGNGQWDDQPEYLYFGVRWKMTVVDPNIVEYQLVLEDSMFNIQSDSGLHYWYPSDVQNPTTFEIMNFRLVGNVLTHRPPFALVLWQLLQSDTIQLDTTRIDLTYPPSSGSFRRTIDTGQSLDIEGRQYDNLLAVVCDDYVSTNGGGANPAWNFWSAYFSKDHGLLAFHLPISPSGIDQWFFLDQRFGSIPIPMSMVNHNP